MLPDWLAANGASLPLKGKRAEDSSASKSA
jgi:hypothetical protein